MTNPLFEGLAEGLKPNSVKSLKPGDRLKITSRPDSIEPSEQANIGAKLDRLSEAAERQADALEALTALFASCIGRGVSTCGPAFVPGTATVSGVNFLRTGDGNKSFTCDESGDADDE